MIAEFEDAIYLTERCTCRSKGKDSKMVFDFGRTAVRADAMAFALPFQIDFG